MNAVREAEAANHEQVAADRCPACHRPTKAAERGHRLVGGRSEGGVDVVTVTNFYRCRAKSCRYVFRVQTTMPMEVFLGVG